MAARTPKTNCRNARPGPARTAERSRSALGPLRRQL
ncbi:hypothetical protein HP435_00790 [Brevibacillus sp. HD3.3A]|nr:hypothetical protein HP435_00790 [Brevibacillus sp. HD3.3A]